MTDELRNRIAAVEDALAIYQPGRESAAVVELPKLALADAVLRALAEQLAAHDAQIAALPKATAAAVRLAQRWRRRA